MNAPNLRNLGVIGHDAAAIAVAWVVAFAVRYGRFDLAEPFWQYWPVLSIVFVMQTTVLAAFGVHRIVWRYMGVGDLRRMLTAIGAAALLVPVVQVLVHPGQTLPRTTLLLQPLLLVALLGGNRLLFRMWYEHWSSRSTSKHGEPVLVIGAGFAGLKLLEQLRRTSQWHAVALLDDDPNKVGRQVGGLRVAGLTAQVAEVAVRTGVKTAIIAMPSTSTDIRRRMFDLCKQAGLEVLTVPSFEEMITAGKAVDTLRPVDIEDLLGREPVRLDQREVGAFIGGCVVMVTGAGGSIGSELCRQILRFGPARLILFEQSEFLLYQLVEELSGRDDFHRILPIIGDVRDAIRVRGVLAKHRPSIVFHAAAYKHVPLMEERNAWEAIRNNSYGTFVLASAAVEYEVESFVLVSTDKAVNPTNVMGASKRIAEMVCQGISGEARSRTRFEVVRFGNVLGSAGSVIPKFQEQIRKGGPVTVTHPEMIRYFMSIPEAAQLVLQAAAMGKGGEIFVLDMGKPVKIVDLARDLIRLSGFDEERMPIVFSGLRPGEKLYEELLADGETTQPTPHPKLRIALARSIDAPTLAALQAWLKSRQALSDDEVRRDLRRWVPEYAPPTRPDLKVVGQNDR